MEGVKFTKLLTLGLQYNNLTYLRPEFLITPYLQVLYLVGNHLISLAEVTQYSWGSSLAEHKYLAIYVRQNPWHCNGSLIWMFNSLFNLSHELIYAKPPFKPHIGDVDQLLCESPDERRGTTVVPMDVIESVDTSIRFLRDLPGKCRCHFVSHYSDVIMRRLKSPASWLFTQPLIQAQIKEKKIKAPRHWPLWGEFNGDRWIPRTKGQ